MPKPIHKLVRRSTLESINIKLCNFEETLDKIAENQLKIVDRIEKITTQLERLK
jgi:hypothetical protein